MSKTRTKPMKWTKTSSFRFLQERNQNHNQSSDNYDRTNKIGTIHLFFIKQNRYQNQMELLFMEQNQFKMMTNDFCYPLTTVPTHLHPDVSDSSIINYHIYSTLLAQPPQTYKYNAFYQYLDAIKSIDINL